MREDLNNLNVTCDNAGRPLDRVDIRNLRTNQTNPPQQQV